MPEETNDPVLESLIPDPEEGPGRQGQQPPLRGGPADDGPSLAAVAGILGPYVAYRAATFLIGFVMERIGKLVAVEGEAAKDRTAGAEGAAAPPSRKQSAFSILAAHCRAGGATSFLRGAKLSLAFLAATSMLEAVLLVPLRRTHHIPRACVILLIPPYLAAATLPLRTLRNLLTTNYICGAADEALPQGEAEAEAQAERRGVHYYYSTPGDVWRRLRAELTLGERLTLGWQLDLCNRYLALGLAAVLQRLLHAVQRPGENPPWLPAAFTTLFAACTVLHHPFTVLTLRLSLLVPPATATGTEEEKKRGEQQPQQRRGLRYRSVWGCVREIVREEGVGALFAGWYCAVALQHAVPLLRTYLWAVKGMWPTVER